MSGEIQALFIILCFWSLLKHWVKRNDVKI